MSRRTLRASLVVVGGGLGGVAAALTAARLGERVVLTETTGWLGGQLSSQGVPPDEHRWIESSTTSPSYAELRRRIRDHYRHEYPMTAAARSVTHLNPGAGFVSRLCHEPRVAALMIDQMLSPLIAAGLVTVLTLTDPVAVHRDGPRIDAVVVLDRLTGDQTELRGDLVIDATELGDLLELGQVDHVIGAESADETHELHAPSNANPLDQQAVTWCAAVEYREGEDHTIDRPAGYDGWKERVAPFWPGSQLSWTDIEPMTLQRRTRPMFVGDAHAAQTNDEFDLWHYRRILARKNFEPGWPSADVTLVNWPQVDYWDLPLVGAGVHVHDQALVGARDLTLSFVHWMQTEAERTDGGYGYPELMLRGDVMGTVDGLAKEVYVRESRRIRALFTVTEAHIGRQMRGERAGSELFDDAVGIGFYRIDLHPSTAGRTYIDVDCFPFQIPLGAMIPRSGGNLVAANKNIGTTHVTNGAYRLHPVEWSIGEAAGALSAFCAQRGCSPEAVRETPAVLTEFQRLLTGRLGITLAWPDDIRRTGDPQLATTPPLDFDGRPRTVGTGERG